VIVVHLAHDLSIGELPDGAGNCLVIGDSVDVGILECLGHGPAILRVIAHHGDLSGIDVLVERVVEVDFDGHVGGQVELRVQRAGAFPTIEGIEGVFEDPVVAGGRVGEALGDAVAGGFDAVFEVEVHFSDDAGHVDALVVAYAAAVVCGCYEVGKFVFGDFAFADCTLPAFVGIFEDVIIIIIIITDHMRTSKNG